MLIVSALSGARSQEFHSSRHMCCDHVTINVIWFDILGEFLVSIVLQIKQKKCTLKLLTEYVLLKKQSIFIWIDYNCSVIVKTFIFWTCSPLFWSEMSQFLSVKINCILVLYLSFVLLHSNDFSKRKICIIDLFLLLGKCYIHQTEWSNLKPNFDHFQTAFKAYLESIKTLKKS